MERLYRLYKNGGEQLRKSLLAIFFLFFISIVYASLVFNPNISDFNIVINESSTIDLSSYFTSSEGYNVIYSCYDNSSNVTLSLSGSVLNISSDVNFLGDVKINCTGTEYSPNTTLINFTFSYLNMTDGCNGAIALAPNITYFIDVTLQENTGSWNDVDNSTRRYTSGIFNASSLMQTNVTSSLNNSNQFRFKLRYQRIRYDHGVNQGEFDHEGTAVGGVNDACSFRSGSLIIYSLSSCSGDTENSAYVNWDMYNSSGACGSLQAPKYEAYDPSPSSCRVYEGYSRTGGSAAVLGNKFNETNGCMQVDASLPSFSICRDDWYFNVPAYFYDDCTAGSASSCPSNLCTYAGDDTVYSSAFYVNSTNYNASSSFSSKVYADLVVEWGSAPDLSSNTTNNFVVSFVNSFSTSVYFVPSTIIYNYLFKIYNNITNDSGDDILSVFFKLIAPNGSTIYNANGSKSSNLWSSSSYAPTLGGIWNYTVNSTNNNSVSTTDTGSFTLPTVDSLSTITNSNVTGNSTINNSIVTGSVITNSTLANMTITDATITNNNLTSGTITYNGFDFTSGTMAEITQNASPVFDNYGFNNDPYIYGYNTSIYINLSLANTEISGSVIKWANLTLTSPSSVTFVDNVNMSGGEYNWNYYFDINETGTWTANVTAGDSEEDLTTQTFTVTLTDVVSIFPTNLFFVPDPKTEILYTNITLFTNSYDDANFTFSCYMNHTDIEANITNSTALIGLTNYNSTTKFENSLSLQVTNSSLTEAEYSGHCNATRVWDNYIYMMNITMGVNPPSGEIAVNHTNGTKCSGTICNINEIQYLGSPATKSWTVWNNGNYTLSNCIPSIKGSDLVGRGYETFSPTTFNLNTTNSTTLTLTLSGAGVGSYYGELEIICDATASGYDDALSSRPDNVPKVRYLTVIPRSTTEIQVGGGGGGDEEEKVSCLIGLNRNEILFENMGDFQRLIITNNEQESYNPSLAYDTNLLEIQGVIGTVLPLSSAELTLRSVTGDKIESSLILKESRCEDININLIFMGGEQQPFIDFTWEDLKEAVFSEIFNPQLKLSAEKTYNPSIKLWHIAIIIFALLAFLMIFPKKLPTYLKIAIPVLGTMFATWMIYILIIGGI